MSEPQDSVVEKCILTSLAREKSKIRPNKLRKIVCRDIRDTNWSQFQRVLDAMIANHDIDTEEVEGNVMLSSKAGFQADNANESVCIDKRPDSDLTVVLKVPCAILGHLVSKGCKKKKNIEENTKTKISFETHPNDVKKESTSDTNIDLKISKSWRKCEDERIDEEKAKRHLETAKLMILKMVDAYKKNPKHFERRKAGGTLAEQEESKKERVVAAKRRGKITLEQTKKKRKRKFY